MTNKSFITLIKLCTVLYFSSVNAQIQLLPDDIYSEGLFQMSLDKTGGFDPGPSGPNKVWDFSTLKNQTPFKFQFAAYNGNGNGNAANLVKVDGTDTFDYILKSGTEISEIIPLVDFDKITYQKLRLFLIPLSYNNSNSDSFTKIIVHTGNDFQLPSYDSIRLSYQMVYTSLADAWGTLKLPMADFNTLRIKSQTKTIVRMEGKKGNLPYTRLPAFDMDENAITYQWFTNNKGNSIATYYPGEDQMKFMVSSSLSNGNIRKQSSFLFANPITNQMSIKNNGENAYQLILSDMCGRIVLSEQINNYSDKIINTSEIPDGIYYLEIRNQATHAIQFEKILKQ